MKNDEIKITIELSEVVNKCLRQIKNTTFVVEYTINAINKIKNDKFPPLQVDGLPFRIDDPENVKVEISPKEQSMDWIMKKAFEEFVLGLTESLIEAHRTVKLLAYAKKYQRQKNQFQINQDIEKINQRPLSLPFPILIDEIESELNLPLQLSVEMKSINNLRNCLVHDNGIVNKKRLNDKVKGQLILKYIELVVFAEKEGQIVEVKLQDKIKGFKTNRMHTQLRPKKLTFRQGDLVVINQNLFNSISYTCVQFVQGMFDAMPKD
ncbi:MAG: hypothetical protein RLZ33_2614 [Bacteroidota bacterium]|jgi:hypothetical protein